MSDRFFLDTNIFVYSIDPRSPAKAGLASQLIREAILTRKGIISYQVIQEFFNVALKRFEIPIKMVDAERYFTTILRPLLSVQSSAALFSEALNLHRSHGFSWYDSLIVGAALRGQCGLL